jgi:hypothetical protein
MTEIHQVSETLFSSYLEFRTMKSTNPVILSVIRHRVQTESKSTEESAASTLENLVSTQDN